MKMTIAKNITAAALVSGAMLASQPASALGIKNCTGEPIRIKIYKAGPASKKFPKRNKTIGVNGHHRFKLAKKSYEVRVFRSKAGFDEFEGSGGAFGGSSYIVRRTGRPVNDFQKHFEQQYGRRAYTIEPGNSCR